MTDYQIGASTRQCTQTGTDLKAGDRYFSALLEEGGRFVRKDYSVSAWQGPPEGAIGFWQGKVPTGSVRRRPTVDEEVLVDCLARMEGTADASARRFRYVLALFLMRRRRLRLEETHQEGNEEIWSMRCTRSGTIFQVVDPALTDDELDSVQEDVFRVLGWQ